MLLALPQSLGVLPVTFFKPFFFVFIIFYIKSANLSNMFCVSEVLLVCVLQYVHMNMMYCNMLIIVLKCENKGTRTILNIFNFIVCFYFIWFFSIQNNVQYFMPIVI